ncbi:MAG: cytoplasmic tRNA 2-thiolation protein 2 [Cirrosporium novae-zelandiae]|nr:MAG: cytoplasmic tRNA 2-thiolation protein 2 [Cirrosporium novae-zelandiae]
MPGKNIGADNDSDNILCVRCHVSPSEVTVRSDRLCSDCFTRYINMKTVKRLETFRVRNSTAGKTRRLLLPVSLGLSSTVLLQMSDRQLRAQRERTGRTGYEVVLLHIGSLFEDVDRIEAFKGRFPDHNLVMIPVENIFEYDSAMNDFYQETNISPEASDSLSNQEKLQKLLNQVPSATSKEDVLTNLRTRLIVEIAQQQSCEGILWGHSTTRLAEKTLSETAKGRGFSLTWQISDGISSHGIFFYFPLRDLLRKELAMYASFIKPSLDNIIRYEPSLRDISASSKSTSIDALMGQYFESVEESYPGIVANVVRTTAKLHALNIQAEKKCRLCDMPYHANSDEPEPVTIYSLTADADRKQAIEGLCYGCTRTMEVR